MQQAASKIERYGKKGFIEEVKAELGREGDDGPLRRQLQVKLRYAKDTAATTTPEAKEERRQVWAVKKAKGREGKTSAQAPRRGFSPLPPPLLPPLP